MKYLFALAVQVDAKKGRREFLQCLNEAWVLLLPQVTLSEFREVMLDGNTLAAQSMPRQLHKSKSLAPRSSAPLHDETSGRRSKSLKDSCSIM